MFYPLRHTAFVEGLTSLYFLTIFLSKATNVLLLLGKVAAYALTLTGFFYSQLTPALQSEGCLGWPSFE